MKGHVATPPDLAARMVEKLFDDRTPAPDDRILFPGFGSNAPFVVAVREWCDANELPLPEAIAIEVDPERVADAKESVDLSGIDVLERDFLDPDLPSDLAPFDYIIGNPPYVPITQLSDEEKERYDEAFDAAWRRYDLYMLFFEQGLELLTDGGRLVYVSPEKYEYVASAVELREPLSKNHVREIDHIGQDWFRGLKTYPAVTTIDATSPGETTIRSRDGQTRSVTLPRDGSSWAASIRGGVDLESEATLDDVTIRISAGLATGRDSLFVQGRDEVPPQLVKEEWVYPTVSGSQLRTFDGPYTDDVIICPYDEDGSLVSEDELGAYGEWAKLHRDELEERSCVQKRGRLWYDWHGRPPMAEILQPKIVCKDVCKEPEFWAETDGNVIPRHSVYYIVPKEGIELNQLLTYLNSAEAQEWIEKHAQKAHTDHIRIQSEVIEDLPVPEEWAANIQTSLV
jgi:adenine-specific DNA-methyltransferase